MDEAWVHHFTSETKKQLKQCTFFRPWDHTILFWMLFGALNPNPTSELLHHVRYSRNPNLKVQKILFFAILGVKLHRELNFFKKLVTASESITFTLQNPL